jgi:hypothetical protein
MVRIFQALVSCGALSVLVATAVQAQQPLRQLPKTPPNEQVTVQVRSGKCPKQVGLWTWFRYYEGGGELSVIADTAAIAAPAQFSSSTEQVVEYKARLKKTYASCVGQATTEEHPSYQMQFRQGNVYFRVDLREFNKNPSTPTEITYQNLLMGRPYVRWAIAD